jgi:hypothetical protein
MQHRTENSTDASKGNTIINEILSMKPDRIEQLMPSFLLIIATIFGIIVSFIGILQGKQNILLIGFCLIVGALIKSIGRSSVPELLTPHIPSNINRSSNRTQNDQVDFDIEGEEPVSPVDHRGIDILKSRVRFELKKTKIAVEYSSLSKSGKSQSRSLLREAEKTIEQAQIGADLRYSWELIKLASELTNAIRNDSRVVLIYTVIALVSIFSLAFLTWNKWDNLAFNIKVFGIPLGVFIWSGIGGFVSVPYRYVFQQEEFQEPTIKWLVIRPIMGLVLGTVTYFSFSISLLVLDRNLEEGLLKNREIIFLFISFFAGFSDRFAIFLLGSVVGRVVPAWSEKPAREEIIDDLTEE